MRLSGSCGLHLRHILPLIGRGRGRSGRTLRQFSLFASPNPGQEIRPPFLPLIPIEPSTALCLHAQRYRTKGRAKSGVYTARIFSGLIASAELSVQPASRSAHRCLRASGASWEHRVLIGPNRWPSSIVALFSRDRTRCQYAQSEGGSKPVRHSGGKR